MKRLPIILLAAVLAAALALLGQRDTALATGSITAGFDLFESEPGSSPANGTYQDLNLPADFFGSGCSAFNGRVFLQGVPIPSFDPGTGPVSGLEPTDTIVERLPPDAGPFPDTIEIEIVAMELKSISPITVTCPGTENWDLDVSVPPLDPNQVQGTMTITHTTNQGGTFDSTLPIRPLLTFTRQGDGAGSPIGPCYFPDPAGGPLSPCGFPEESETDPVQQFQANDVPWCHDANPLTTPAGHTVVENSLTTDFFAGITCTESTCPGTPCTRSKAFFSGAVDAVAAQEMQPAENPAGVGGIALVDRSDSPAGPDAGSGSSVGLYAALAVAAGALAATSVGWYARRRFRQR